MTQVPPNEPDDSEPDQSLVNIYEEIQRLDDTVYETLCPSFVELGSEGERYQDNERIGEGALKEVYRTFDQHTRRWVAMARLRTERGLEYFDLFVHEAWLISSLSHPNIIKVHDTGVDADNRPFFTMELKGKNNLSKRIRESQGNDLTELLEAFMKICDAVAYAHAQGVLHLDLKPDNIQCSRFGEVLVCDWGLGRRLDDTTPEEILEDIPLPALQTTTITGAIKGSPGYMAPEQLDPDADKDERTDVYALGSILHTILTGEPPFTGSREAVLKATAETPVPPLSSTAPERHIPPGLEAIALKATRKDPERRYQSVSSLKTDVHKYLTGYATDAEQPGFFREAKLFLARNRVPALITTSAFALITVLSVLFIQNLGKEQMATAEEKRRADQLLAEVNVLSADKIELLNEFQLSKKQLATRLSRSANFLRRIGFDERPVETVVQAERLIQQTLTLDPSNKEGKRQRIMLKLLQLNCRAALNTNPKSPNEWDLRRLKLANVMPKFAFNVKARPNAAQLSAFFQQAYKVSVGLNNDIEDIMTFHTAATQKPPAPAVMNAFLQYFNRGQGSFDYDPQSRSMQIQTKKFLNLQVNRGKQPIPRNLLRFVPIEHLSIAATNKVPISQLNNLEVQSLDLSQCQLRADIPEANLPNLRQVTIQAGGVSREQILKWIVSDADIEIIEVPELTGSSPTE